MKKWFDHFQNLLGKESQIDNIIGDADLPKLLENLNIKDAYFIKEELLTAKITIKEGKSPGPDNIPPEVMKRCNLDDIVFYFANKLLNENLKPNQLSEIDLLPIPKTGDFSNTKNYR